MNRIVRPVPTWLGWAGQGGWAVVGLFEYFIQAHKALFGPCIRSPTTKEMGKGLEGFCRGVESLGFELFALWF